jgi:hypothetical protein
MALFGLVKIVLLLVLRLLTLGQGQLLKVLVEQLTQLQDGKLLI